MNNARSHTFAVFFFFTYFPSRAVTGSTRDANRTKKANTCWCLLWSRIGFAAFGTEEHSKEVVGRHFHPHCVVGLAMFATIDTQSIALQECDYTLPPVQHCNFCARAFRLNRT